MKVLVACEFTGTVRDAFIESGHTAISCDIREPENGGPHIQGDVMEHLDEGWDLMIAHPPCTYLCNSGVRWLHEREDRWQKMIDGAVFFRDLLTADIPKIAIENPVMHKYARKIVGRGPDFTVQPWQFGDPQKKRTCWWTKNLPELQPTEITDERRDDIHKMAPGPERSKKRSRFFDGIAQAMADQYGGVIEN